MTTKTIPIVEARKIFTSLPEELQRGHEPEVATITRRGKPVLAVMPWNLYESLVETMEILGDEELMRGLRRSFQEAAEGKTIPWETVKAKHRL